MSDNSSSGGRKPRVTDTELKKVLRESDAPILTTAEVADSIPISKRQTQDRLKTLGKQGEILSKGIAGSSVWWHGNMEMTGASPKSEDDANSEIGVGFVDELDLPGGPEDVQYRRRAVSAVFEWLFLYGDAKSAVLKAVGWVADSEKTYDSMDSLWSNCIYKALDQVLLFNFKKQDDSWNLSPFGEWMRYSFGNQYPWMNWEEFRSEMENQFLVYLWKTTERYLNELDIVRAFNEHRSLPAREIYVGEKRVMFRTEIDLDPPIWKQSSRELNYYLWVNDNDLLQELRSEKDILVEKIGKILDIYGPIEAEHEDGCLIGITEEVKIAPERFGEKEEKPPIRNPTLLKETTELFYEVFYDRCKEYYD